MVNKIVTTFHPSTDGNDIVFQVQLSPSNPELVELNLTEYFDEYVNKRIRITVELAGVPSNEINRNQIMGTLKIKDNHVFLDDASFIEFLEPYLDKSVRLALYDSVPIKSATKKYTYLPELENPELTLWYLNSTSTWTEALPIGNGKLAAMIFGGANNERVQLNEGSIWYGGPLNRTNPDGKKNLDTIRQLLINHHQTEAEDLADLALKSTPPEQYPYQVLENLNLFFEGLNGAITDYHRELNLTTGIAKVAFKCNDIVYKREFFCSYSDNVIVIHFETGEGGSISFQGRFERYGFNDHVENNGCNQIRAIGQAGPNGVHYELAMMGLSETGTIQTIGEYLIVKDASAVTLLLYAETSFYTPDYHSKITQMLEEKCNIPYEELRQNHINAYQRLFNRVSFELNTEKSKTPLVPTDERINRLKNGEDDDQFITLYFQYGRYLLMSCSRSGFLPATLQGLWNESLTPPWGSKYTININTEMNYWPVEVCNLAECHLPLFEHLNRMKETGTITAQELYGCRGWVAHHNTNSWADTSPVDRGSCSIWPMGGAWLSLHLWEHYLFGQDRSFLADQAYPLIKGAAEFFIDYLIDGPDGYLLCGPSVSPENTFINMEGKRGQLTMEATMDREILYELFSACIEASKLLEIDEEFRDIIQNLRDRLPPIRIGKYGQIQEWGTDYEEVEVGHRHMSHLFGLHPGTQITPDKTPDLAEAAKKTLFRRLDNGGGHTGWSCAWIINFWARLKEGMYALDYLKVLLSRSTYPNMFDAHPPFQIDGNFGGTAGIAEMLLQSQNDVIDLLPALPIEWESGKIHGLKARGNYVVDISWADHQLLEAEIKAFNTGVCRIRTDTLVNVFCNGELVSVKPKESNIIEFSVEANTVYQIMK